MIAEFLNNYAFLVVMKSAAPLGAAIGMLGGFIIQRKDVPIMSIVPNGAFTGVLVAYIVTGNGFVPVIYLFAALVAIVVVLLVNILMRAGRINKNITKVFMSSVFFGLCMMLFTYASKEGSNGAGLKKFIFGETATILKNEMDIILYVSLATVVILFIGYSRFKITLFDPVFARTVGISATFYNSIFGLLCIALIASGIQILGILLVGVLFIAPAAAAHIFVHRFGLYIFLSGVFGFISASAGGYISSNIENIMTGPAITLAAVLLVFLSIVVKWVFGLIWRRRQHAEVAS